jgi:hypothetical protein
MLKNEHPHDGVPSEPTSALAQLRELVTDALRYWELRRLFYNALLALIVLGHFLEAWPASKQSITFDGALGLFILAVIANVRIRLCMSQMSSSSFQGFAALGHAGGGYCSLLASPSPRY